MHDLTAAGHTVDPASLRRRSDRLFLQVLVAIAAGGLLGYLAPDTGAALKPLGDAFIALVKMVIAPVIFLTLTTGIANMSELGTAGRIAGKAFAYFLFFSTLALVVGLIAAHVVQPGNGLHIAPASLDKSSVEGYVKVAHDTTLTGFLLHIIPASLLTPLADGEILPTLFVAILCGVTCSLIGKEARPVVDLLERLSTIVFRLTALLMRAAPVGAFGAIAFTVGKFGVASLLNLAGLVVTIYVTSFLFIVVVLGAVAHFAGFSILRLLRYLKSELLLVLGTSSSEAALPSLMQKLEEAGCAKPVVGLVVPTGYSFNLDGTNIYMSLAALFIAQACDVHLTMTHQLTLLGVAMLSSKGAAGVTGAGFITLAATLSIVPEVPVAGIALILGIDRFMSQCRSLTNFVGNAVATIVIAGWEGALDRTALRAALDSKGE